MKHSGPIRILPVVLLCLLASGANAQAGAGPDQDLSVRVQSGLSSQAESEKMQALGILEEGIKSGQISTAVALRLLEPTLVLKSGDTDYNNPLLVSLAPVRIRALKVLDTLPDKDSWQLLLRVIESEIDDVVVEQAMLNLRAFEMAPGMELQNALVHVIRDPYAHAPHDGLMLEAIKTISVLHQKFGTIKSRALFDALLNLSDHPRYLQLTRKSAMNLVRQLAGIR